MNENITKYWNEQCYGKQKLEMETILLMIIIGMLIVKVMRTIWGEWTWEKVLEKSRNEAFVEMKRRLGQERNFELDMLHEKELWNDNAVPSCVTCYRKYVNTKICNNKYTSLLFIIDSILLMKNTNNSMAGKLACTETFYKILRIQHQQSNSSSSFAYFTIDYLTNLFIVCLLPATQTKTTKMYC